MDRKMDSIIIHTCRLTCKQTNIHVLRVLVDFCQKLKEIPSLIVLSSDSPSQNLKMSNIISLFLTFSNHKIFLIFYISIQSSKFCFNKYCTWWISPVFFRSLKAGAKYFCYNKYFWNQSIKKIYRFFSDTL